MGRNAGIAAIWVVILVALNILLIPFAVLAWVDRDEAEKEFEGIKAYKKELEETKLKLEQEKGKLLPGTGFLMGQEGKLPEGTAGPHALRDLQRKNLMPIDPGAPDYKAIDPNFEKKISSSSVYESINDLAQLAFYRVIVAKQGQQFLEARKKVMEERPKAIKKEGFTQPADDLLKKLQPMITDVQARTA